MARKRIKSQAQPDEINAAERRGFALRLRKRGLSYRDVAAAVRQAVEERKVFFDIGKDYDERRAYRDVITELTRLRAENAESAEDIRTLEVERLDTVLARLWARIERQTTTLDQEHAQDRAIATFIRLAERRAKLLGLDAPTKTALTDSEGQDIKVKLYALWSPEEWPANEPLVEPEPVPIEHSQGITKG